MDVWMESISDLKITGKHRSKFKCSEPLPQMASLVFETPPIGILVSF